MRRATRAAIGPLLIIAALAAFSSPATATEDKVTICHAAGLDGTTHYVELTIGYQAVYGPGGHFNENGTPQAGHEQDYLGPCEVEETPAPTPEPTPAPTPEATPEPTPEATPAPTPEPTPAPEATPTPGPDAGGSEPTPAPRPTLPSTDAASLAAEAGLPLGIIALLAVAALLGAVATILRQRPR